MIHWLFLSRYVHRDSLGLDTDSFSVHFKLPKFYVCHAICDVLLENGRAKEAIAFFREMKSKLAEGASSQDKRVRWSIGECCVAGGLKI